MITKKNLQKLVSALFLLGIICSVTPATLHAGNINAQEAGLIGYVSGEFEYNGKYYVATEEARGALRSQLSEDGVDLTADDVATAKKEFNNNLSAGIAAGYLIEKKSGSETTPVPSGGGTEKEPDGKEPDGKDHPKDDQTSTGSNQITSQPGNKEETDNKDNQKESEKPGNPENTQENQETETDMPVKNTGYVMISKLNAVVIIGFIFVVTISIALINQFLAKKNE